MGPEAVDASVASVGVHSNQPLMGSSAGAYKLPPDVELSKTNLVKARELREECGPNPCSESKRHQVSVRQDLIHENKADIDQATAAARSLAMTAVSERLQQTGLITLSR